MKTTKEWKELPDSGNKVTTADSGPGEDIENLYDNFLNRVAAAYPKVNNNLLVKIMALERKFPNSLPHVHLEVDFKEGIDIENPKYDISEKHHVQVAVHRWEKTKLVVTGMMNVSAVAEISSHDSVIQIIGSASAAYY